MRMKRKSNEIYVITKKLNYSTSEKNMHRKESIEKAKYVMSSKIVIAIVLKEKKDTSVSWSSSPYKEKSLINTKQS